MAYSVLRLQLDWPQQRATSLNQRGVIIAMLATHGMTGERVIGSAMNLSEHVSDSNEIFQKKKANDYRSIFGGLLYLAVKIVIEIATAATILGTYVVFRKRCQHIAIRIVFGYLHGNANDIMYLRPSHTEQMTVYADVGWCGEMDTTRRSRTEISIFYDLTTIFLMSCTQIVLRMSSSEAEYMGLLVACKHIKWML